MVEIAVKLRPAETRKLLRIASQERRRPADQASLILSEALAAIDVKAKAAAPAPATGVSRPDA